MSLNVHELKLNLSFKSSSNSPQQLDLLKFLPQGAKRSTNLKLPCQGQTYLSHSWNCLCMLGLPLRACRIYIITRSDSENSCGRSRYRWSFSELWLLKLYSSQSDLFTSVTQIWWSLKWEMDFEEFFMASTWCRSASLKRTKVASQHLIK